MAPAICNQGLCTRKARKSEAFCTVHQRLKPRAYPEGTRVKFTPHPVSAACYTIRPRYGACGVVVSVPLPGGRRTYLPGPAGGLLYVRWDADTSDFASFNPKFGGPVCGVSPLDCYRNPERNRM